MKVTVKTGKMSLYIPIPNAVLFSRPAAKLVEKSVGEDGDIPPHSMEKILKELKRYRRKHGKFTLAEVESADGTRVKVEV